MTLIHVCWVFAATFALDYVWAKYTMALTIGHASSASVFAGTITMLSGFAAIIYVNDPWMLIPAVAGAVGGTWVGVSK